MSLDGAQSLVLGQLEGLGLWKVGQRARANALATHIAEIFGMAPHPGAAVRGQNGVKVLWWAPGAWLVKGRADAAAATAHQLGATLDVQPIEISAALPGIDIRGALVADFLSCGCPLDVFGPTFAEGLATRTRFGAFDVLLDVEDTDRVHLHVRRSVRSDFELYLRGIAAKCIAGAKRRGDW